jgi:hypothetical protein
MQTERVLRDVAWKIEQRWSTALTQPATTRQRTFQSQGKLRETAITR